MNDLKAAAILVVGDAPYRSHDLAPGDASPARTDAVRLCREWAEDHWEAVGVMLSVLCALTVATALAVAFNVISTQL